MGRLNPVANVVVARKARACERDRDAKRAGRRVYRLGAWR